MIVRKCELPFFPGFYNSIFDLGEKEYEEAQLYFNDYVDVIGEDNAEKCNLSVDDFEASKEQIEDYMNVIATNFVYNVEKLSPEWVKHINFVEIVSPKFYNYSTDKIICDIELSNDWKEQIERFIDENYEELKDQVRKDWSDRSGFWSFVDNDIDNWINNIEEEPDKYIPLILQYQICYEEGNSVEGVSEGISEITYEDAYLDVTCNNDEAEEMYFSMK